MYKLFVVAHKYLYPEYLKIVRENIVIYIPKGYNTNKKELNLLIEKTKYNNFNYILEYELKNYNSILQTKRCHAPTLLYHAYINKNILDQNVVGLMEYDLNIKLKINDSLNYNKDVIIKKENFDFNNTIYKIININKNKNFVIFLSSGHKFYTLFKQFNITVNEIHWLDFIIKDYNQTFNKNISKLDIFKKIGNRIVPTQQSFICNKLLFLKISKYIYDFINKYINLKFNPMICTVLERVVMIFFLLEDCEKYYIPLEHKCIGYKSNYN